MVIEVRDVGGELMASPFPGMDPYLESYWGDVQTSLAVYARDQLRKQLPAGLVARIQASVAVEIDDPTDDDVVTYFPDVQVVDTGRRPTRATTGGAVVAEPLRIRRKPEPPANRSVRITTADGGALVTAIEILSPSNKIGRTGRDAYRNKQETILASGASIVEIDLIRAGRHVMSLRLTDLPKRFRKGYKALVVRGWNRGEGEFYPLSIRTPLPAMRIPLRKSDPDVALDLRASLALIFDNGGYDVIDYRGRLEPDLFEEDAAWADEMLKAAGKR